MVPKRVESRGACLSETQLRQGPGRRCGLHGRSPLERPCPLFTQCWEPFLDSGGLCLSQKLREEGQWTNHSPGHGSGTLGCKVAILSLLLCVPGPLNLSWHFCPIV